MPAYKLNVFWMSNEVTSRLFRTKENAVKMRKKIARNRDVVETSIQIVKSPFMGEMND